MTVLFGVGVLLQVGDAVAECPNMGAYQRSLAENRRVRDQNCRDAPGSTHCKGARAMVAKLEAAVATCRRQSSGGQARPVAPAGQSPGVELMQGLANIMAEKAARDAADRAAADELEAMREQEREREREAAAQREREELDRLRSRLEGAYSRGARYAEEDDSACKDPAIQRSFPAACRGHRSAADEVRSLSPPLEILGGCSNAREIYVAYGATPDYPSPSSYSSGAINGAGSCAVVSWCLDPTVWRAHKATHGAPPAIEDCWDYDGIRLSGGLTRRATGSAAPLARNSCSFDEWGPSRTMSLQHATSAVRMSAGECTAFVSDFQQAYAAMHREHVSESERGREASESSPPAEPHCCTSKLHVEVLSRALTRLYALDKYLFGFQSGAPCANLAASAQRVAASLAESVAWELALVSKKPNSSFTDGPYHVQRGFGETLQPDHFDDLCIRLAKLDECRSKQ